MTICQLTYHPCFDTQFRDGQTTQQYFRAVAMSSRNRQKRSSCFCPKRAVKRKKGNRFDKDWTDKHAAGDKGSYDKQHEFEEGQDFEEAAIDGFLKPYKAFIKDQTARQRRRQRGKRVRGIRRQALLRWEFLFHWSQW